MNKKILSLILSVTMALCLLPTSGFASGETTHLCEQAEGVYCLVCDVAEKINALPDAEEITEENAAAVTDQVHAIDRLKGELDEDQFDQVLTLVDSGNDGSGYGTDVPVKYMNAVKKVQTLGGNSLIVTKKFTAADGSEVNVDNAEVVFEVTNIDTDVTQTLTMSILSGEPGTLSYDADFYSTDSDGWTYKYILPDGTYQIKEKSDNGATVNGEDFVTTSITYSANDEEYTDSAVVTLADGNTAAVTLSNVASPPGYTVKFVDRDGNPMNVDGVCGMEVTDEDGNVTIGEIREFNNVSTYQMTDLTDGVYQIAFNNIYGEGYSTSGFVGFEVKNGMVDIAYDEENNIISPYSFTHIVSDIKNDGMTVEVASILYNFRVTVPGIDAALPFEVKDSEDKKVAYSDVDGEALDYVYLQPGDYTFHSLVDETFKDLIEFPTKDEYVEFTINDDYSIAVKSDDYDTEIEDYGDAYGLIWYLSAKDTVTISAQINTNDGTAFVDGTQVMLYLTDHDEETGETIYSEVKRVTLPADANEYSVSWKVAAGHLEYDEVDGEPDIAENIYSVVYMNADGEETFFEEGDNNVWTATVDGRGAEFEILSDAGYYAPTSESDGKVGVIVFNALIKDFTYIEDSIVSYGVYLSTDPDFSNDMKSANSSDVETLKTDGGYYHAILKNIPEENFGDTIYWQPFVMTDTDGDDQTTYDQRIKTGDIMSISVWETNKWLGSSNPYAE